MGMQQIPTTLHSWFCFFLYDSCRSSSSSFVSLSPLVQSQFDQASFSFALFVSHTDTPIQISSTFRLVTEAAEQLAHNGSNPNHLRPPLRMEGRGEWAVILTTRRCWTPAR